MSLVLPSVQSSRGEQSCVTDTVMKLVCVYKQAVIKTFSDGLYTPLWCDPVSLSLSISLSLLSSLSLSLLLSLSLSLTQTSLD